MGGEERSEVWTENGRVRNSGAAGEGEMVVTGRGGVYAWKLLGELESSVLPHVDRGSQRSSSSYTTTRLLYSLPSFQKPSLLPLLVLYKSRKLDRNKPYDVQSNFSVNRKKSALSLLLLKGLANYCGKICVAGKQRISIIQFS